MRGLFVLRWLTPATLAALLFIPVQTVSAHPSGGGHAMGGMGGHGMGSMGGHGPGNHPTTSSHFFSHTVSSHFTRQDRAFDRADRFRDRHFFEREGREEREFFFRHNFFVAFDFAAFGFPWWGPWGPWWWYPDYADYPYYNDAASSESQTNSQDATQYWNDLAKSVQSKLAQQSYYRGPIDGVIGSGSLEAIRRFQADHGLRVNGKIDPKLLKALGVDYKAQSQA